MQNFGRLQTRLEGCLSALDLVRSGQGSGANWCCGFRARSLRDFPVVVGDVVGHESVNEPSALPKQPIPPFCLTVFSYIQEWYTG